MRVTGIVFAGVENQAVACGAVDVHRMFPCVLLSHRMAERLQCGKRQLAGVREGQGKRDGFGDSVLNIKPGGVCGMMTIEFEGFNLSFIYRINNTRETSESKWKEKSSFLVVFFSQSDTDEFYQIHDAVSLRKRTLTVSIAGLVLRKRHSSHH